MLLIAICCAWVLGIFLGSIYHFPWILILTAIAPVPFIFAFRKAGRYLIASALCLAAFFGAAFYYPATLLSSQIASLNNRGVVELKAAIDAPPDIRDNITHVELSAREIKVDAQWQKTQGKILLFLPSYPEYQYGNVLQLKGNLEDPPRFDEFDYQAYLSLRGIYSTMVNPSIDVIDHEGSGFFKWVYSLRDDLSRSLFSVLPEPQASLAQGIILGLRSSLPDSLSNSLSVSGAAHLLAISGVNLSIIAGIMIAVGHWLFGRRHHIYVWLALFIIWFYSLITGMQAPVIRSSIMTTLFLFAELSGRQKNAHVAIALAAAIMLGIDPQLLWSTSFQLTFLAMTGLVVIAPVIRNTASRAIYARLNEESITSKIVILIGDNISVTLGALIVVWPVVAYNFNIISFVAPLSTFLIAPALPFIILLGLLTAITGLFSIPLAAVLGWTVWIFLSYMLWITNSLASFPFAAMFSDSFDINWIKAYYTCLGTAILSILNWKKLVNIYFNLTQSLKPTISKVIEFSKTLPVRFLVAPLLIAAFLTSYVAPTLPDGNLHVSLLDVGEGDSIFIKAGNQNILIDGGPSPQAVCSGLSNCMPLWDRNLDLIILSHPHLDHMGGLIEVLRRYRVLQIMSSSLNSESPFYHEWLNLISIRNITTVLARTGLQITLENGAKLEIINPPVAPVSGLESDLENNGVVARLSLNKVSFLFTADISQEAEAGLVSQRANLTCTVLKVAHHGSSTSTSSDFLIRAKPKIAMISVGSENTFGHPSDNTLNRLNEFVGLNNIYRTDKSGLIEFTTDGQRIWVKTDR